MQQPHQQHHTTNLIHRQTQTIYSAIASRTRACGAACMYWYSLVSQHRLWHRYSVSCVWRHESCSTLSHVTTSVVLCENYIGCQSVNESCISCVYSSTRHHSDIDYITDLLQPVAATSSRSSLRDASRGDYVVPRTNRKTADRAFSIAASSAWNQLPTELKRTQSTSAFRRGLKTFLFNRAYRSV